MALKEKIVEDLKDAMKKKDQMRTATLRMIRAEILKKEKESVKVKINDEIIAGLLQRLVRQHKDSIEQFEKGGREDLVRKEETELRIIESYMPEQVTEDEIKSAAEKVIEESGATSLREMGKVMGQTMQRLKETEKVVDGGKVSSIVKGLLEAKAEENKTEEEK